jgi:hypothetical protein
MSKIPMDLTCVDVFRSHWFGDDCIVWVTSTTTPLVTYNGFVTTHEDADIDCFILDEGGSCYKDEWDKIFQGRG